MREATHQTTITVTVFTEDAPGTQVGATYRIGTAAGPRWMAEVHDYNGEFPDGVPYTPLNLGVFDDPETARAEIAKQVQMYGRQTSPAAGV